MLRRSIFRENLKDAVYYGLNAKNGLHTGHMRVKKECSLSTKVIGY
jgi:hypothetical protein